jgi:hypothetical protein
MLGKEVHTSKGRKYMVYQQVQQVQNKPTAAYILSLLGGIFGLLAAIAFIAFGALTYSYYYNSSYYYSYSYDLFGWGYATLLGLGIWMLITSILTIVFAAKLKSNPMEHTKWGALILIFSIIGLGGLFGFIGGILALVYKPQLAGSAPQYAPQPQAYGPPPQATTYGPPPQQPAYQQPMAHNCPQCGTLVQPNVRFCPNCGKQQY